MNANERVSSFLCKQGAVFSDFFVMKMTNENCLKINASKCTKLHS
jgi:hypothetical protein